MSEQESSLNQADTMNPGTTAAVGAGVARGVASGVASIPAWERSLLEKLLSEQIKEQRSRRRWGIFFKVLTILLVLLFFGLLFGRSDKHGSGPHTAVVEINGVIDSSTVASAQNVNSALNRAFSDEASVGVILRINSPGGSSVQSNMINDEIGRLRAKYPKKPLHVVVEEMCASGGYYIAVAGEKIHVNRASIVGSIGVLMDSFGFTDLMGKLGVERRLMTAGENKAFLDPFSPSTPRHKAFAQAMLDEIHQQFIAAVRKGRGSRLKETPEMFSGLFWSGEKAVDMGLADDFATLESVARDVMKQEQLVDYTEHEPWSDRVMKKFGAAMGAGVVQAISSGSAWNVH